MRATAVSMDGVLAGRLSESPAGVEFRYEPTWLANPNAVAVSLHLPLRSAPYQWPRLPPCFTNLLPEVRWPNSRLRPRTSLACWSRCAETALAR